MDDQRRLADVAEPIADIVLLDRLVLADDGMQGHLAEMARVVFDPGWMLGDEASVVEIREAAERTLDRRRIPGVGGRRVLATAVGRAQDQAAHGLRMLERELLKDHATHRESEPVRRCLAGVV